MRLLLGNERISERSRHRVIPRALLAFLVVVATVMTAFGATTSRAGAVELPPDDENSLFIQTSGPNAGIGIGDWYTAPGGGNQDHLLDITIPATWPAALTVTVALYDPEVNNDDPTGLLADDEPRPTGAPVPDDTTFWVTDPNGVEIANTTYTPTGGTNGQWTELVTFTPIAGGGVYTLENSTSDDDDNSWRLSVAHDPDCADGVCSVSELNDNDEYDDPDGVPGTADEIEVELIRTTFQHAGTGLVCNDFYFYVDGSKPAITLHNFDMDNAGSVVYTLPDGSTENGTVSGSTRWNSSGDTTRVGDTYPVDSTSIGWWSAEICLTPNNQYIFEGEIDEPVFLEEPPPLPDIELTKTDNLDSTVPGATLSYLIGYDNISDDTVSPAPAFNVVITDTLPANTTFVGCSFLSGLSGTCSESGGIVTWAMSGQLPSGDTGAVGLDVTVDVGAAGAITNVADVTWLDAYGRNYAADAASDIDLVVDSDLFITKASDVAGVGVDAGDVITYTVDIANVGDVVNTSIVVDDAAPTGTTYVAESTTVDYFEITASESWTDDFSSAGYSGGTPNWSSSWLEIGESNGPATEDVNVPIESGDRRLHIQDNDRGAEREVDLTGVAAATLSFDMKIVSFENTADDFVDIEVSADGGNSWTLLERFVGPIDETTYSTHTYDLTPHIAADTRIRFVTNPVLMGNADDVYIDNVSILGVTTAPATKTNQASDPAPLADGVPAELITVADAAALAPGQSMTLTYQVSVDERPGVPRITNIVTTSSVESPDQIGAAEVDPVLVAEVTGVAFEDANGNGLDDIVDDGMASVTVELLDGSGSVLQSTTTNPTGGYRFENLVAGEYAVRFATPSGAQITLQDQGLDDTVDSDIDPSDGRTTNFTLAGGVDVSDMDGGYVFGASIGDQVWVDSDGDGTQGGTEPGLAGVTVELLDDTSAVVDSTVSADGTGTDPVGFYSFTDIVPGTYSVRFVAPSGYVFTIPDQVVDSDDSDPDRITGETSAATVVSSQAITDIDAGLFQPIVIGDVVWLDLDGDGIQDSLNLPGGEPGAAGVEVNLFDNTGTEIDSTTTATDGSYRFNVPQPGTYQIEVDAGSFSFTGQAQGPDPTVDSDVDTNGLTPLFAVASGVDDLSIDAGIVPTTLGDTVWLDADADGLQSGPQTGVAAVTVNLRTAAGVLIASQLTGPGGNFSFDVGPGEVMVEFVAPNGYAISPRDRGTDDDLDSDPDPSTGRTATIAVTAPTPVDNVDAGLFQTAIISDRVWLDRDGNGVQDADTSGTGEPGLAGVTVNLFDSAGAVLIDTTSTADGTGADPLGHYQFDGIAPGSYVVEFSAPPGYAFTTQDAGGSDVLDSDADPATGRTTVFTLVSGATLTTADAGLFEPATIGDRAWLDSDGDGLQDGSEIGISGVTVELLDAAGTTVLATTTTADGTGPNPIGHYRFTGVAPGSYRISMSPPGGERPSPQGVGSDPAVDSDLATTTGQSSLVTVTSGGLDDTVDGGFYQPGTIGDRVWADTNGDGVQDAGETGLAGITVRLLDSADNTISTTTTADGTGTDPVGFYQFVGLDPGSYRVEVLLPVGSAFSPLGAGPDGTADSDVSVGTGRSALLVVTSGWTSVDIDAGIHVPVEVGDLVWNDTDADGVQDPGEQGLAGVTVNLLDATGTSTVATTTTADGTGPDPLGNYRFTGMAPGTYIIEIEVPPGYAPSPTDVAADDVDSDLGAGGRTAAIGLVSGDSNSDVDGGLYRAASIGDRVWLDTDGDGTQGGSELGLAGVTVNLLDGTGTSVLASTVTADGTGTDPVGHYRFTGLSPGSYLVEVVPPAGHVFTTEGPGTATDSDVAVADGRSGTITVSSGSSVTGVDAGVYRLASLGDLVWNDSNGDGLQNGAETGLADITVRLLDGTGSSVLATTTTADGTGAEPAGHYEFGQLAPGDYRVEIVVPTGVAISPQDQGAEGSDSDISTSTGRTTIVTLTSGDTATTTDAGLYLVASIGDRVWEDTDADGIQDPGEPGLAGVPVNLLDSTGTSVLFTTTTADGTGTSPLGQYQFDVGPGTYIIEIIEPVGYALSPVDSGADDALDSDVEGVNGRTGPMVVASGAVTTDIDAGLHRPGSIGDLVWDDTDGDGIQDAINQPSGEPGLAGVTVRLLESTGTTTVATTTTADGTGAEQRGFYSFDVAPGDYIVEVVAPSGFDFTATSVGGDAAVDSDVDQTTGRSGTIIVTSGSGTTGVDGGLYRTSSVGDVVWVDLDGDGRQDLLNGTGGEPGVAGITVNLLDSTGSSLIATTSTADGTGVLGLGEYRFANVVPGAYRVEVQTPGFTLTTTDSGTDDSIDSDVDDLTGLSPVFVVASGTITSDIDAGVLPASIGNEVWEDDDGNGIRDGSETGLAGVTVNLLDAADSSLVGTATTADGTGVDPIGHYRFSVAPGSYIVEVSEPAGFAGTAQNQGSDPAVDSDIDANNGQTSTIVVTDGSTNDEIDAGFYRTVSLGNRLWDDTDADGIQDGTEAGLAGVPINLLDSTGTTVVATTISADGTGAEPIGHYQFTGVVPGTYVVEVVLPPGRTTSAINQGGSEALDSDIGPDGRTAQITLSSGDVLGTVDGGSFLPAVIGDRVWLDRNGDGEQDLDTSATGEPGLAGVTVALLDSSAGVVATTTTADGTGVLGLGEYRFSGVIPGEYEIELQPPANHGISAMDQGGNDAADSDIDPSNGRTGTFVLGSGDRLDLDGGLWGYSTIGDLVFSDLTGDGSQSGDPGLGSVTVRLFDESGTAVLASTESATDGSYAFTDLAPGNYVVDVDQTTVPGGFLLSTSNDETPVSLTSGDVVSTVDFGFEPTSVLTIDKTPDTQEVVATGTAAFDITVVNNGAAVTGVSVSDPLAPNCDRAIGNMASGASISYSCTLDNVTGDFTNTATVDGTGGAGAISASDTADVSVLVPGIDVSKSPDSQNITVGDTANFSITVRNTGSADLEDVVVIDPSAPDCDRTITNLAVGATSTWTCSLDNVTANFTNRATATGTTAIGTSVADDDTADVTVLHPAMRVEKSPASQTILTAGTADFTITIDNTGETTLNDVIVTDTATPDCNRSFATIPVGQVRTITCSLVGVAADFTNQVEVIASDPNGGALSESAVAEVEVIDPSVSIEKTPDTQGVANGGTADFTIEVTNTGDVPLVNVVVSDPLAPDCDRTITSLAVGAVDSADCSLTGVTADFTNVAEVVAETPLGGPVTDTDAALVDVLDPSIIIAKAPDSQTVVEGGSADFTITVTNTGDVELTGVTVTDPSAPACDTAVGTLAAGATQSITCSMPGVTSDFTNTATVLATAAGIGTLSDSDTADVVVLSPDLDIQKSPNVQQVPIGGTADFEIRVTNAGAVDLNDVTVSDPLAPGCDNLIGDLLVGQTIVYSCSVAGVSGDFVNTATVEALDPVGTALRDLDTATVDAVTSGIDLTKSPDGQAIPTGGTATFTVEVANSGELELTNVVVSDPAAPGCSTTLASLAPGRSVLLTCSVSAVTADFTATADVVADVAGGGTVTDADAGTVTVLTPAIAIEKTPGVQSVLSGGTATFTITVSNAGETTLEDVVVSDPAAPGCDRVIGTLLVSEAISYTCTLSGVDTDLTSTATADATDPLGAAVTASDAADVIVLVPSISIVKGPDLQTVPLGGTATFDITVTNTGGVDLFNVSVTDPLVPGCDTIVGPLAVGQTQTTTCALVGVSSDFTNTATVLAEDAAGNVATADDSALVAVAIPGIELSKTPDTQQVMVGDDAEFTIEVTNTGTETIATATVSDPLAPDCDASITNLAVGASTTITCVSPSVGADFVNVASVAGTDSLGNPVSDADDARVDVVDPAIAIAMSPDPQVVVAGGDATFNVTVQNTGDVPLNGVDVTDPTAAGCDRTFAVLAPGQIQSYVCTVADVTAAFTNTIEVTATDPMTNTITASATAEVAVVASAMDVTKSPVAQQVEAGTDVVFDITVRNTGATVLTAVLVDDPATPDCNRTIGTLPPGGLTSYSCTATEVMADFTNTVIVTGEDPLGQRVTDTASAEVDVLTAVIDLQKTPDTQTVVSGGTATFVLEVSNFGRLPLTALTVTDAAAPDCDTVIPVLAPSTSTSITCTRTNVTADFTNTAELVATTPAGETISGSDSADITVLVPSITLSKTPDVQSVPTNGTASFTLVATNNGQTTLGGVAISDPLASGCDTSVPVQLAPGQSHSTSCSVIVGATGFTNVATVTATDPIGGAVTSTDDATVDVFAAGAAGGLIFIDRDGDGMHEPGAPDTEPGLGGVMATLVDAVGDEIASTDSRADGSFAFSDVPIGTYTVRIDGSDSDIPPDHLLSTANETQSVMILEGSTSSVVPVGYTPQATIGGDSFIDADGDGVDEGTPLAGVSVTVLDILGNSVATRTTAPDGSWIVSGLYPGAYSVRFDPPEGHLITTPNAGADDTVDSDADPDTGSTQLITLAAGSSTTDIDGGFFRPVSIGDTVFADHDGDGVQAATNEPGLPGVEVIIVWAGPDDTLGTTDDVAATVTTDDDGSYLSSGIPPGTHEVGVVEPAGTTVTSGNDPAVTTLASGQTDNSLDFGVRGSGALAGTVVHDRDGDGERDGDEPGIDGVDIEVTWAGPDGILDTTDDSIFTTTTASGGTWSVTDLQPGRHRVDIDEHSAPDGLNTVSFDQDSTADGTTEVVLLPGTGISGMDTGLAAGATIGDTVFADDNRNGRYDSTESGLDGVVVIITWHGSDGALGGGDDVVTTTTTDTDGTWLADQLAAGTYTVTIDSNGVPPGYRPGGPETATVSLGEIDLGVDIGLIPNQPATISEAYDVTVTVGQTPSPVPLTDPDGDPATITLISGSVPGLSLNDDGSWLGTATTPGTHELDVSVCDAFGDCTLHTLTILVLAQSTTPLPITGGSVAAMLGLGMLLMATGAALRWWRHHRLTG